MEGGPSSWTMEKDSLPQSNFIVHGVNRPSLDTTLNIMVSDVWYFMSQWWISK